jgi:predicted nucleotidyltransferase
MQRLYYHWIMSTKAPTPYPDLNQVLQELMESQQEILGENFVGAYLQGSFAIGDFDEHSDVDFIVVVEEEMSEEQVQALQVMHKRIFHLESPWAQHLEGSYFPWEVLGDPGRCGEELWYIDNGGQSLERSDHCNTLVVRWAARENGVILAGPPPKTLIPPVTPKMLRAEIFAVISGWGQEILDDPEHYNNRFYQGFIVLSYCRMLHDLKFGEITSKVTGAEWAKANLDPDWSALIDRSWATRPDPATSVRQPPDPEDFQRTLEFVRVVIEESQKIYFPPT